jgi:hypothetical protein
MYREENVPVLEQYVFYGTEENVLYTDFDYIKHVSVRIVHCMMTERYCNQRHHSVYICGLSENSHK